MSKVIKDRILSHEKNALLMKLSVKVEDVNLPHVVITRNANGVKLTLELDQEQSRSFINEAKTVHDAVKGKVTLDSCHNALALKFCSEYKFGDNLLNLSRKPHDPSEAKVVGMNR